MTPLFIASVLIVLFPIIIILTIGLQIFFLHRIIKIQHDDYYDQWVEDGKPSVSPIFHPYEDPPTSGIYSYRQIILGIKYLFKTPGWIKGDLVASKILSYYRLSSYVFYGTSFTPLILILTYYIAVTFLGFS